MLRRIMQSHIQKHRELIMNEAREMDGFMELLLKQRNSEAKWTPVERSRLRRYLWRLAAYVPALCIFLLPGGLLLIPVLAEVMDRRRTARRRAA
jgi:hypothetical protein